MKLTPTFDLKLEFAERLSAEERRPQPCEFFARVRYDRRAFEQRQPAREPYDEPPRRIAAEVTRREPDPRSIWLPKPGETLAW